MAVYTVRTIKNKTATVEINGDETVDVLIQHVVEELKPEYQHDTAVLILRGRPLDRDTRLSSLNVKPTDKIVIMKQKKVDITRAKPSPTPAPVAATPPVATVVAPPPTAVAEAAPTTPEVKEAIDPDVIEYLMLMGFAEDESREALAATGGDKDAAVLRMVQNADVGGGAVGQPDQLPEDHPLYDLINSDVFEQMKQQVAADPSALAEYLVAMTQANPQLAEAVVENEEVLLRNLLGGTGTNTGQSRIPPLSMTIELSESDERAIGRLQELGFDRTRCIEAYLACDKNEEYAANFLFEEND